jgi:CheY-like chemotaxis protein
MKKILIVEDNFDNMTLIRMLMEQEGFQILLAKDGKEGLEIALRDKPDLIALDLGMPVMDGWEFIRIAKSTLDIQEIPIVVVTANLLPGESHKVIDLGCAGYVSKPFKVQELVGEIRRCLVG